VSRIVVTGASRGIGAALAIELAARGHALVLVARDAEALVAVSERTGGGEVVVADLADLDALAPVARTIEAGGPIDVLVNNAGIDQTGEFAALDPTAIARLLTVNLTAPLLLTRAVLPEMLRRGAGHVVNVSSLSGTNTVPGLVPYSASKAGLSHATGVLRHELRDTAIATTLVEIGPVRSEMMDHLRSYGPTRRSMQRIARLGLTYDLPMARVVRAIANGIEQRRRHVRLPRRDLLFPLLTEAPRRVTEVLLRGVDLRPD
jgi:short-subunit dehydrogenase